MSRLNMIMYNKRIPTISITITKGDVRKFSIIGEFKDYINKKYYIDENIHGVIYIQKRLLNNKKLTINTSNKSYKSTPYYNDDGTFIIDINATGTSLIYCFRVFYEYLDKNGKKQYVYSDMVEASLNSLS